MQCVSPPGSSMALLHTIRALLAAVSCLLCLCLSAQAQRPREVSAAGGALALRAIQYKPDAPADESIPVEGLAQLLIRVAAVSQTLDNVPFVRLTSQNGVARGVELTLPTPLVLPEILGPGSELRLPSGKLTYDAVSGALSVAGGGTLRLPVRGQDGKNLTLSVPLLTLTQATGRTTLALRGVSVAGDSSGSVLALPEVTLQAAPANLEVSWGSDNLVSWKLSFPSATVRLATPGLATADDKPLRATVTNFTLDQSGVVRFDEAELEREIRITPGEAVGFELLLKSGRVAMPEGVLRLKSVVADLTLPELVKTPQGGRAVVRGLSLQWDDGPVAALGPDKLGPNGLELRVEGLTLTLRQAALDLSQTLRASGVPTASAANAPRWMGIWIAQGELTLPADLSNPKVSVTDFLIEPQGVSGTARLSNLSLAVKGFPLQQVGGAVTLRQNQVTAGELIGALNLPGLGALGMRASFTTAGQVSLAVRQNETLRLEALQLEIRKVRGQLRAASGQPARLALSGELAFGNIPGLPEGLRTLTLELNELGVDSTGKLFLPRDGCLTFPKPKRVAIGPLGVELRRIGFETRNNDIYSVTLSGGADLGQELEGLPLAGGVDFEGLTIARDGSDQDQLPDVTVGGIRITGKVEGLGSIEGELQQKDIATFGASLYGGVSLELDALGGAGIELDFLVAPQKRAWFVGGGVALSAASAIRVTLPTPGGPVPIFNIYGFGGGFGFNVAPNPDLKPAERGRISDPERQLVYRNGAALLQATLLVGDQVTGNLWWGETTLTLAFNPLIVELAGKVSFLDPGGPRFAGLDEWEDMDRTASVFINIDTRAPAFTMGGGLDFYFPTRQINLMELHGQAELKLAPREQYVRVGWEDAGQRPVSVAFLASAKETLDIRGEAGFELDILKSTANFIFDTRVVLKVPDVNVTGTLRGRLVLDARQRSATGQLKLRGVADFEFFEASVKANLAAKFNTTDYPNQLNLKGKIKGKAGFLEAEVPFEQTFRR